MFKYVLIILLMLSPRAFASVAGEVNKANELYKEGRFDDSLKLYQAALEQDEKSDAIQYDLGTDLYKKGDYAKALGYLEQAARDKNLKIKPRAEYNLGNVLYKSGVQREKTNLHEALKNLQDVLGEYTETLKENPKDADAQYNQDIVKKEIERLKKQQQHKQQNQKNQQRQNQNQQQKQQQNQQKQKNQENQKNQQNQQNQSRQNQQKQNNQNQQQSSPQNQNNQPSGAGEQNQPQNKESGGQESQQDLDRQQAQQLLQDYQESEEPKKLLNYMPKKIDDRPVLRDW